MLVTVGEGEFDDLVKEKEDIIGARNGYVQPAMIAMTSRWMAELDQPATLILIYIVGRTVCTGKAAERISVKDFVEGTQKKRENLLFSALPMSLNTLRKYLKALCDGDLITIYSARSALEGTENQARMFEINFKKLLDVPLLEVGRDEFFERIERQIALEKEANPYQKLLVAPS